MKEPQTKINVNFRIISFGHAFIEVKNNKVEDEVEEELRKKESPIYFVPKTTNLQWFPNIS